MARRSRIGRLSRRSCRAVFHAAVVHLSDPANGAHHSRSRRLSRSRRTYSDHGGRREGHRLARSGKARPCGRDLFSRQRRFSRRPRQPLSRASPRTAPVSSRCPIAAMPARADSRASRGFCWMPRRPMPSPARYSADRIVVWGFSLGTGVAVALAADQPVGKLILEAPYTSIADVAAARFRFVPVRWLMRDQFRSDQRIARVTAPLLIMHGDDDPAIPIPLASDCSRWPMSRSNSCGFPKAATTIWTIMARSKRLGSSSMLQRADGCRCLAHSPFSGL